MSEQTVNLGIETLFRLMAVQVKASAILQIMIIATSSCAECCTMVRSAPDKQIPRIFEGFFTDKLQFSRTKMKSFTIFTSSAMADHIILYHFPPQRFVK